MKFLDLHENAQAALAGAIGFTKNGSARLGSTPLSKSPLARTLARYRQVLYRLGRDWNDSDVVYALWEVPKIYDSRVWWGDSKSQGNGWE